MQGLNWNDFRYLLAIKRGRRFSAAARLLDVDTTTVSRRLGVLRSVLADDLYHRQQDGSLVLTEVGSAIAAHSEKMEREVDLMGELLDSKEPGYAGTVRITSVPFVINRLLVPQMNGFLNAHPKLQIELFPDNKDHDLNLREADVAIRFARPNAGGFDTLARRIGSLGFSVFASQEYALSECNQLPWIGYEDHMAHLPQAKWIASTAKRDQISLAGLRVHDIESAIEAAVAGIGKTLLPNIVVNETQTLQQLSDGAPVISREVWLLTHRSQQAFGRIIKVTEWIETLIKPAFSQ